MAAWLVPALKVVLNNLPAIASVAAPVFTRRSVQAANEAQLLQQQIAELQAAATQNANGVKALAEQLRGTLAALQQAAAVAETRLRRAFIVCLVASGLSVLTLGAALYMIFTR